MIERNISLASTGSARTSGCDNQLRLGYSRNRGIYRLNIWIPAAGVFVRRVPLRPRTMTSAFWPGKCFREMEWVPACVKASLAA